ncbi:MAG: hypothetical protein JNM38_00995 [Acidobacteria bacterium]|nr:hypothetical protein [Acidobacteriota bacterium]
MADTETARLEATYRTRRDTFAGERARYARQSLALSWTRGGLFALAVIDFYAASGAGWLSSRAGWVVAGGLLVLFLFVLRRHEAVERAAQVAAAQVTLCDDAIARLGRHWDRLPVPDRDAGSEARRDPTGADLDLEGRGSLRQLLGRTATPGGAARLSAWMAAATRGEGLATEIAERQAAVRELAPLLDLRARMLADAMVGEPLRPHAARVVDGWISAPRSVLSRPWFGAVATAIPLGTVIAAAGLVAADVALAWVTAIPLVSWGLRQALSAPIGRAFGAADVLSGEGRRYLALIRAWEDFAPASPRLVALRARLVEPRAASAELTSLKRLIDLADLRWSHLPHFLIHSVTAWDVHVAAALERWRHEAGPHVGDWFDALADLDALATLASLAHDEPGWTDALVEPGYDRLEALAIAHPLLAPGVRVANDVEVGPSGTSLVITGSNMSGKSTLLRAIGLNVVLAQLGAPVCAARLRLPRLQLETSIRISDSLTDGVSYFMSALLRLKGVVAAADASRRGEGPVVCYLLDEVLQGTNSEERQVAVRRVLVHLVSTPAIGAMTTHDLHLVHTPEFVAHARHVHFTEHVDDGGGGPLLTFDYRLRPGPATSRNALALMRMIGLG